MGSSSTTTTPQLLPQLLIALITTTIFFTNLTTASSYTPPWQDAFIQPSESNTTTVDAQSVYTIEWKTNGSASANVDLFLMSGARADALSVYLKIAGGIPDNGSHRWSIHDNLVDQGYFAIRIAPSPNPYGLSVTSSQFHLDVLKAENPCYDGAQRCYPPLPPGWHQRLAIVLGAIIGGLVLLCAGGCFCCCRVMKRRKRRQEASVQEFQRSEDEAAAMNSKMHRYEPVSSAGSTTIVDSGSRWSRDGEFDDIEMSRVYVPQRET